MLSLVSADTKYTLILGGIFVLILFAFSGCSNQCLSDVGFPVSITEKGSFVAKSDMSKLAKGQEVPYTNVYTDCYYLPADYVVIEDGKVHLR